MGNKYERLPWKYIQFVEGDAGEEEACEEEISEEETSASEDVEALGWSKQTILMKGWPFASKKRKFYLLNAAET